MGCGCAPDLCAGRGTRLCPAWMEPAEPQGCRVRGAAPNPPGSRFPSCWVCAAAGHPSPWGPRSVQMEAAPSRPGRAVSHSWVGAMVFEVRQSPEAEQLCLKGAGFVVCPGVPEASSLCHDLAWPLRAASVGRKLGKRIGSSAGASASGSFCAAGVQRPCE